MSQIDKEGRGFFEKIEKLLQLFPTEKSVEIINSQYKVHAHDNSLPNGVNDELDVWTDNLD